jgi:hypothetical protein
MAYYERYEAAGSVAIARQTRRLLEDVAEVASAMYRVGDGRQADVLRARVEIARMDEEVVRMGAMLAGATARLAAAADSPPDAVAGASVLPAFPDTLPALETLESLAFETRPMLAAGAADVRAASADARLARRELWPDLRWRAVRPATHGNGGGPHGKPHDRACSRFARSRQLQMRETAAMQDGRGGTARACGNTQPARRVFATLASAPPSRALPRDRPPLPRAATMSALASYRSKPWTS